MRTCVECRVPRSTEDYSSWGGALCIWCWQGRSRGADVPLSEDVWKGAMMMNPTEGQRRRDAAIASVSAAADPAWNERALRFVQWVAARREVFTTADVFAAGLEMPREGRAIGAVMRRARTLGVCVPTMDFVTDPRPGNHATPIRVWRAHA